jgi:ureidoglycolate lyase
MTVLLAQPLTKAAFAPFGDVIETAGARHFPINAGTCERFHDLARIDVEAGGGRPLVSIARAQPARLPVPIRLVERHPLGSQIFLPLVPTSFLIVVALPVAAPRGADLRAFLAAPGQGVNYARNTWHHPLIALDRETDFLIVDRGGEGANLEEHALADDAAILTMAA